MEAIFLLVITAVLAVNIFLGGFLFLRPEQAIRMQQVFYARINWRMEPISMNKEIRNTRIMGVSVIAVALLMTACFFIFRI